MKKIAIVGAHGVGKTRLCEHLRSYFYNRGKTAIYLPECVRECPLPIHDEQTIESTLWLIAKQISEEMEALANNPDYLICDRSAMDPMVYMMLKDYRRVPDTLHDFINDYAKSYHYMYLIEPTKRPIDDDGFRNRDKGFQASIHNLFVDWTLGIADRVSSEQIFNGGIDELCKQIYEEVTDEEAN